MAKKAAKAVAKKIEVENVGPIDQFSFSLADYGVTILSAANGSGKSILLSAVAALAKGEGKVPLRDNADRGSIEGFGARISIAAQCRHQGGFDVSNLEGRFDLSELVDPGIADPEKADKRRVKAMIALTGAKADAKLFSKHKAFAPDANSRFLPVDIDDYTDLLDMAEGVRRFVNNHALLFEKDAQTLAGEAKGIRQAVGDVNENAVGALPLAQQHHEEAVQQLTALKERQKMHSSQAGTVEQLKAAIATLKDAGEIAPTQSAKELNEQLVAANNTADALRRRKQELEQKLQEIEGELSDAAAQCTRIEQLWHQASEHETKLRSLQEKLEKATAELDQTVGADEVKQAELAVEKALQDVLAADKADEARAQLEEAAEKDKQAKAAANRAKQLRAAASAVDEVLSGAIKCPSLRVEQLDDVPRLVTDHPQRGVTPYSELSEGERWRIAIDLGADQVGEGGLLVIPQHAWEGIDAFVRPQIHAHAQQRKVYILTAEATRSEEQGKQLVAAPFEGAAS